MIKAITHENGSKKANGTSYIDAVRISYQRLVDLFGEPLGPSSDHKVSAEWHVSLEGPLNKGFVTIYNYKTGKNYSSDGQETEDIMEWHMGGKSRSAVYLLEEYLGQLEGVV